MREKIAEILGVSVQDLADMPPEIVDSMAAVFETIPVKNDEDRKTIYSELEKLWAKGVVILGLKEIAERTKIPDITLFSLDYDVQKKLVFEYMADSENVARIFEIIVSRVNHRFTAQK